MLTHMLNATGHEKFHTLRRHCEMDVISLSFFYFLFLERKIERSLATRQVRYVCQSLWETFLVISAFGRCLQRGR